MLSNLIHDVRIFLAGSLSLISAFTSAIAADKPAFEAEAAKRIGGASKVADRGASGGSLVGLSKLGQGVKFARLPAASKLAIRYASVEVGTISVAVNDQPARKLNVHSSGALTNSFLHAIIDVTIPANAMLTIHVATNDVAVNIDRIVVGNGDLGLPPDIWNLPPLPVAAGPYSADWKALSRVYTVPEWWREAKFGAWAHWDPQSMPERGDWYARGMYMEGNGQYNFHIKNFGHPSEYGYKDICHNWVIDRWNPNELMDLYVEMGARYFMAMGVHHDNFDCWDSAYQPWNSVRVGPKGDVVGTWEKIARRHGLRFGIGFHNTPARTWGQFMTVRYTSDKKGPKQGVPYDALQTILDGKGKWWEGMDPVDLYGPVHTGKNPLLSPFTSQFMWRVDDAITKYHPDMIYFDEHAGDSQMDLGVRMGLGFLAPPLIANYYNKSLQWNHGNMDVVINLKGVGGRYNSFQNNPDLLPYVDRALVKSTEAIIESQIMAYPFQTETSIADWHYQTGQKYMDARSVIRSLMRNVSRNGSMLLNLTQHGRGDLDPQLTRISKDVGAWLKINGEAVYASRPFEVSGDNTVCYTRNQGKVYATLLDWSGSAITLKTLSAGGATLGNVSKVELLGSDVALTSVQDDQGLTVTPAGPVQPLAGITNQQLALGCRVLRITHDKGWFNDDDPGAVAAGWVRRCNLGSGDFNNDLTTSETTGDIWSCSFTGTSVSVVAPKDAGAGKIEIQIDGQSRATADLSTAGTRQAQQVVCELTGLSSGKHAINIVNRGPGPVAVDALIVRTTVVAPELIRIQKQPLSNWVTCAKANAIRAEFIRQADKLDGLADGVIHNYLAARALFDLAQGDPKRNPWAALRGPDGKDPNPADTSVNARLTDGQIETLKLVYSRYSFATPLANGVRSFGMWVPNTDPAGSGLIADRRFRGQEGAGDNAPMHAHLGVLGVTGFLMQNLSANPLDYVEGGPLNKRREEISEWLDSTNPDLSVFYRRGGKMIVTVGTDDTLASPGAQLDYFQSMLDKMGRENQIKQICILTLL